MNQPPAYVFHGRRDLPPEVEKSRDTYQREKKRESSKKRSGSAARSTNKWTYSAVLSFLDPCITPSGNMGRRGGGPWKSGPQSPERRKEQRQQQGHLTDCVSQCLLRASCREPRCALHQVELLQVELQDGVFDGGEDEADILCVSGAGEV
ncbi:hypothetical protein EYF80_054820 [Liparis tanakae]|uniref:Uncharacterized protein n=1 Tax=Liparis tanakae TaxID=230148 RepID=A0A4Z2F1D6_9TELE|nr:hypothetical protein EYF80_054820 [Liparis tanakae]